jgi:hypothetical protein
VRDFTVSRIYEQYAAASASEVFFVARMIFVNEACTMRAPRRLNSASSYAR